MRYELLLYVLGSKAASAITMDGSGAEDLLF